MKIVIGYDGSMRSRAAAAMLREQGHIVSAAYVTASSELPAELESKAASDGLFITAVYGDDSTTEGVISALCGHMKAYGFGAAATGHIARVSRDEKVTVDGENGEKQTVIKPCGAPRIAIAVDVPSDESAKLGLLSAETVAKLVLPLGKLMDLMHDAPMRRFGCGTELAIGQPADLTVFNLSESYVVEPEQFLSMGRATPFAGVTLTGVCKMTMIDGKIVWKEETL